MFPWSRYETAGGWDDALIDVARLALSAVAAVSFPIIHFTSRLMLYDLCVVWLGCGAAPIDGSVATDIAAAEKPVGVVSITPEPAEVLMPRAVRWILTLFWWGSCVAFALSGYELGFIFAIFGEFRLCLTSTCAHFSL